MRAAPVAARDFDFLIGRWKVRHRRLTKRLSGSNDWEEFPGLLDVTPILHGLGNVDHNVLDAPGGQYLATTLRTFDRVGGQWSIYWMDGSRPGIDQPLIGGFRGKIGRFYNDDALEGRPIKVRFTYCDVGPGLAVWDQAFSIDAGKSWEINWTMEFTRVDEE